MPTITSLSPTSGPASGGNSVVVTGTGFSGVGPLTVRFGSVATTFTIDSDTRITAIAPAGTATVAVTVTALLGGTSNALPYTYVPVPSLRSISPAQGPTGVRVTVNGSGLSSATGVNFGGAAATSFTIVSDTQITATVPPGTGIVAVTVTSPAGMSNPLPYIYVPFRPTITSLSPSSGPPSVFNTVVITGSGFTGPTTVRFGSTATTFTMDSPTQITAIAPPGTGTVPVTVTTAGGTSNAVTYTYLTTPTLTSVVPNSGPAAGGNTVVLTGTNLTGATAVKFGAAAAISFTMLSATQIAAVVPAGAGTVAVTVTNPIGTSNPVSYTYISAPTLSSVVPNSGPQTGGNTVLLTGTGFTGTTAVNFGARAAMALTVNSDTQITAIAPAGIGTADVTVTATGGTSNPVTYTYIPAPTLASIIPSSGPATGGNTIVLTGIDLAGATVVRFGANTAIAFTVVSDTQISALAPAGTGIVDVIIATTGGVSSPVRYTYIPSPALASIVPDSGPEAGGNTVTLTGTNLTGATAVSFNGTPAISFTVVSDTQITAVALAGSAGPVVVTVATAGGTSNGVLYTYVAAPTVVSTTPDSGPQIGGNTVVVQGTGFTGTSAVRFGATPAASFTVVSDTEISAIAPAGTGSRAVTVTATGGTSNPVAYTYVPAPVLGSVVPDSGPETGGNTVVLTGTDFTGATAVRFGANTAISFTVVSDTQITADVPAGTGIVDVTVATAGGVSSPVRYTYVPVPALASIVPVSGPETGDNTVTLTGADLAGVTAVRFGANTAVSFTVVSDTTITAVVPTGTGLIDVTVITAGGLSNPVTYTYIPAPTLTTVVPSSGPETGGNTVTLTGTGLTGAGAVDFGGTAAVSFTVVSDTEITAVAPAGTGTVTVTVTAPGGDSNGVSYTYVPAPTLASVVPDSGPETGGNVVILSGTRFTGTSAVHFDANTAVSFTVVSDTEITAVVPAGTGSVNITVTTAGGVSNPVVYSYVPAPALAAVVSDAGPEAGGNPVTIIGSGLATATTVIFGQAPAPAFTVVSDSEIRAVAPAGAGTAAVTVETVGGTSDGALYKFIPAPTLASVDPGAGPETGGNTVTLTGGGFTGASAVDFGPAAAVSFTVVSGTEISAVVPAGTGTVDVTITTPGGTSNGVRYAYAPAPTLTTVAPNSGPETGGNTVILTGSGFTDATAVEFGANPAGGFTVVSDSELTAVVPAGIGSVNVTVTTAGGTSNPVAYAYVPRPTLTSAVPRFGPETGGNTVTLTGANFTGTIAVRFGTTLATSFTVVSDTQIMAVAPARTGTVAITVTTRGGRSNGVLYGFTPAPTLTTVAPRFGPVTGGNTVTLTGANFTRTVAVRFGATPATSFTVVSDTEITAVAPARAAGVVGVTVTTTGGTSNAVAYGYGPAPTLTSVAPRFGPETGGNTVTLTGTNLTRTLAVRFGTTPATSFTVVSDTQVTAVAPARAAGVVGVTVTTTGGTSNAVAYGYGPAPTLTSVAPRFGPETGGNT
ncbi:IPT/TIG domain-containing protein, partial [Nocardia sp. NPDC023852]|uniref:beta strand repeat-containing protein n=1 Tax=Nocardia sp. NPDC023852 TaxID=3154697 RepID=UPI0033E88D4D